MTGLQAVVVARGGRPPVAANARVGAQTPYYTCQRRTVSIDETREEILRLIARVNRGQRSAGSTPGKVAVAVAARGGGAAGVAAARERMVEHRQRTLDSLRQQRARLEASAGAQRARAEVTTAAQEIIERLGRMEERLAQVEQRLEQKAAPAAESSRLPADCTLGGRLRDGLLTDLLQLVGTNQMTGDFCIGGAGAEYHLYFEDGEIRHAVGPGSAGEEAVFGALAIESGHYHFRETGELPGERTIHAKTQFLILEALRQIDERSGGG